MKNPIINPNIPHQQFRTSLTEQPLIAAKPDFLCWLTSLFSNWAWQNPLPWEPDKNRPHAMRRWLRTAMFYWLYQLCHPPEPTPKCSRLRQTAHRSLHPLQDDHRNS